MLDVPGPADIHILHRRTRDRGRSSSKPRQVGQRRTLTGATVENPQAPESTRVIDAPGDQTRNIVDVHEIPRRRAIAIDRQRSTLAEAREERRQNPRVGIVECLSEAHHVLRS